MDNEAPIIYRRTKVGRTSPYGVDLMMLKAGELYAWNNVMFAWWHLGSLAPINRPTLPHWEQVEDPDA